MTFLSAVVRVMAMRLLSISTLGLATARIRVIGPRWSANGPDA